jgi:hypothetical protein
MDILIQNGKAHELFPNGAPELHPSLEVVKGYTGTVEVGYVWDGTTFSAPPAPVDTRTYAEKRASEYPSIGDQLDALFHAGVFPAEMAAQIQAVKDKYPKGGSV